MSNNTGSCCCGGSSPPNKCPCNPNYPWSNARVTIAGVHLAGYDLCWNTYDSFNNTVYASKEPAPGTGIIGPYYEGSISEALTGCVDSSYHEFTKYTLTAKVGWECQLTTEPPGFGQYGLNVRMELVYYFIDTANPGLGEIQGGVNVINAVTKSPVILCGSNPVVVTTVAPIPGPLGSSINVPGTFTVAFQ